MQEDKKVNMWPVADGCASVSLKKFARATDERDGVAPVSERTIEDVAEIEELVTLLHAVPVDGDMFKSFSDDVEVINVTFVYGLQGSVSSEYCVSIYGGHVQLPDTAFSSSGGEGEASFVAFIEGLLK
jgi:hypothetical protein